MRVSGCESQARIRIPSPYFAGEPLAVEVLAELDGAEPESLLASLDGAEPESLLASVDPDAELGVASPEPSFAVGESV